MAQPYYGREFDERRWDERMSRGAEPWGERGESGRWPGETRRFEEGRWGRPWAPEYGTHGLDYDRGYTPGVPGGRYGDYGRYGEYERYGRGGEPGWRGFEERGPFERLGDRIREGARRIGRGPKGFKRPDDRICEEVCERVARSGIDAENVEVKVNNGEVTLTGTVDDRRDKRFIEDIADDVFGVHEVHNQLRVAPGEQRQPGQQAPRGTSMHS